MFTKFYTHRLLLPLVSLGTSCLSIRRIVSPSAPLQELIERASRSLTK